MLAKTFKFRQQKFLPGEYVKVRGPADILFSLDSKGELDDLPFMPEMIDYCGKVYQIYAVAHKTCDTATRTGGRRLEDTVHLSAVRCDGTSHGGCQAACLLFWKQAWLEPVPADEKLSGETYYKPAELQEAKDKLQPHTTASALANSKSKVIFRCQATRLPAFTNPLAWWDVRQYWRDLTINRVSVPHFFKVIFLSVYSKLVATGIGYRFWIGLYNRIQRRRGAPPWPRVHGTLAKTPTKRLNLEPGELVRIKSLPEIAATLDSNNKNRGLWFDAEMARYCGKTYRVKSCVKRIINEGTGEMMEFSNPCIILEDVWCRSEWSSCRLFCPRGIYSYWREIWLERVSENGLPV